MNLTLKVTTKENANMNNLLKLMCSLNCRIKIDSENGEISIKEMDDNNMDSVLDAIKEVFDIKCIDIIPAETTNKPEKTMIPEDSIEFKKMKCSDTDIERQINNLLKVADRAMHSVNAKSSDICKNIISTSFEISMKYNPKPVVKCEIGDIVECNLGSNLKHEVSGGHIHCIICDIDENGMLYVVPITKYIIQSELKTNLILNLKEDVIYNEPKISRGMAQIKKGRYINPHRVNCVIGEVLPSFFENLLKSLHNTFNFSHNFDTFYNQKYKSENQMNDIQYDDNILEFESVENKKDEGTIENTGEDITQNHSEESSINEKESETIKQKISAEKYITEIVSEALNVLDKSKPVEEQIDEFLDSICFPKSETIKQAFISACSVKKFSYGSIHENINKEALPNIQYNTFKEMLKDEFKKWLDIHPEIKEKYKNVSITILLKIFAKKFA